MRDLCELRQTVDAVIADIKTRRKKPNGAINWADLRCREAAYFVNDKKEEYYRVVIEEAESASLASAIGGGLEAAGWPGVLVETEW